MKKIITLALIFLNGMLLAQQYRPLSEQKNGLILSKLDWQNDLQSENLKGKIKSIETYFYNEGSLSPQGKEFMKQEKRFFELFNYNPHGNLTEHHPPHDSIPVVWKYNPNHQPIAVSSRWVNIQYFYENGLLVGAVLKTENTVTESKITLNEKGNVIKQTLSRKKISVGEHNLEYDENGYLSKIQEVSPLGILDILYTNDSLGRVLKETILENDAVVKTKTMQYNPNGDLIQEIDGAYTKTFSYEYDNQGNWMLRYEYINDKRTGITERVITYYE
ncbi:RHS repeat protein [Capnocytophaga canimorsus]|uniref:RHS repeat protein n=1 Tax=Capnocytophaga canimorsus TaxID=28188 RepID=UPI0037D440CC